MVAELGPPRDGRSPLLADAMLAEAVRKGWLTPPRIGGGDPPPRMPVLPAAALLVELAADRAEA